MNVAGQAVKLKCIRSFGWIACFFLVVQLVNYAIEAQVRAKSVPSCRWRPVENSGEPTYSARYCRLDKETVLLQIYGAAGGKPVAERSFQHSDAPNFFWKDGGLIYDAYPDGDTVRLPPTFIDKLKARLP